MLLSCWCGSSLIKAVRKQPWPLDAGATTERIRMGEWRLILGLGTHFWHFHAGAEAWMENLWWKQRLTTADGNWDGVGLEANAGARTLGMGDRGGRAVGGSSVCISIYSLRACRKPENLGPYHFPAASNCCTNLLLLMVSTSGWLLGQTI